MTTLARAGEQNVNNRSDFIHGRFMLPRLHKLHFTVSPERTTIRVFTAHRNEDSVLTSCAANRLYSLGGTRSAVVSGEMMRVVNHSAQYAGNLLLIFLLLCAGSAMAQNAHLSGLVKVTDWWVYITG